MKKTSPDSFERNMTSFTAIDFETAQGFRHTICAVGLVRVENGTIVKTLELLVQPPDNVYWQKFSDEIHGIRAADTEHSPTFDKVWPQIEPYITGQTVVAHNGLRFDFPCLEKTLNHYGLQAPDYDNQCTYQIYGNSLADLCATKNIELDHHNALSDALACAKLYLMHIGDELLKRLQQGDKSVVEALVQLSQTTIEYYAKLYAGKGADYEELISAGKEALTRCALTEIGNNHRERFFSNGGWWVKQEMLRRIEDI